MQKKPWFRFAIAGAAAGLVNGLFGAGGGMVLIPLLIRFGRLEDKQAFSSSIYIILPICLISLLVYSQQQSLSLSAALPYLAGGLLGGIIGGLLFRKASPILLHRILGAIIIWGGIRLLC